MDGNNWSSSISMAGRTIDRGTAASWNRIGPNYFETVGTRVLRGRTIEERDVPGNKPVVVVNEEFGRRFLEGGDPIGSTVGIGGAERGSDFEIVGVVEDVKYMNPNQPVRPMMFLSAFQTPEYSDASMRNVTLRSMMLRSLVIKTRAGAPNLEAAIRAAIAEVSADVNVSWVRPLSMQVSVNFRIERLLSRLTSLYGGLALLLTALGLYGVTAYGVASRTREIGVRMALGAGRSGIMRAVVGGPLLETVLGLAIGLPLAMLVGRAIGSQLYGLGAQNPLVWSITIGILVVTSILAAAIPARRAASIDPSRALRGE
jgi:ABC-type antimicrobial peptide transport system permease subunit